ncbi:hypothetical protein SLEP1_g14949 [Rubroshorea leprosula]|uniref:Uncharacterized protein n=1 Tax=Rubroshorea leprosula TaxID=152421 RepID=A0AAV5IRV7_9ROSI|nr:hypothetical protein SLEP1_g14949 [Rubroshorea leprosula]
MAVVCRRQGRRHSRVQAIWCRARGSGAKRKSWCRAKLVQEARPGAAECRLGQSAGSGHASSRGSAAGGRVQCSRAQAPVQQGAGLGGARHRLGCSRAGAQQGGLVNSF